MQLIKSFEGINAFHSKWIKGAVCLPGIGIFIGKNSYPEWFVPYVLYHEYGHYLDYRHADDLKPFRLLQFYLRIGVPSLLSAMTQLWGPHKQFWTELRANKKTREYCSDELPPDYEKYFPTI